MIDLSELAHAVVEALITGMTALVGGLPIAFEHWLLGVLQSFISSENSANLLIQNPLNWITRDKDVIDLYQAGIPKEVGIALLVMSIQGIRIMMSRVDMYEAIGRTVFCILFGEAMLFLADWILGVINTEASAIFQVSIDLTSQELPGALELGIVLIVAAFFAALAWVKGALGVVFLKALVVSAPYFLSLSALPLLEGLGQWWVEEFTTWALRPFMVALVLRLGLGLAAKEAGPIGLLFTVVSFWLAYTIEGRIRRFSVGMWGSVAQLQLFQRGARLAAGALSGGTATAAAAAATP